jgi:DNA-binding IclR family transcriptional regulator
MASAGTSARTKRTGLRGRPAKLSAEQAGSRTILAGLMLLQAVAQMKQPATLTEIAKAKGMSASRAYRYLKSLTQAEFLKQDPSTGRYDIGLASIELGLAATARLDAVRLATDLMRPLTDATGLVSLLSVWGSNGPTVIKSEQGNLETAVRVREGVNLSLPITAVGRVFLAYLPAGEIKPFLQRDIAAWNATAVKGERLDAAAIAKLQEEVRQHGLSHASGIRNPAVSALAAPVFAQDGRLAMCLALTGLIGSFDTSYDAAPAMQLKATAQRLSRMLGGLPRKS